MDDFAGFLVIWCFFSDLVIFNLDLNAFSQ